MYYDVKYYYYLFSFHCCSVIISEPSRGTISTQKCSTITHVSNNQLNAVFQQTHCCSGARKCELIHYNVQYT